MGSEGWSIAEDGVLIDEHLTGLGWEVRAAARLPNRSEGACEARGRFLHLRSSDWMRAEMKRMGLRIGEPLPRYPVGRWAVRG